MMGATSDPGVERGCGTRVKGGVYAECGTSRNGVPLEHFLVDPPKPMNVDHKVGVELIRGPDDRYHLIDWVGSAHYPNVADFLEEGLRHGFSRRLPRKLDLTVLDRGSRLLIVHARGKRVGPRDTDHRVQRLKPDDMTRQSMMHRCAVFVKSDGADSSHWQADFQGSCSRDHWSLPATTGIADGEEIVARRMEPHESIRESIVKGDGRILFYRQFVNIEYPVFPPAWLYDPEPTDPFTYEPALVATLPITNVTVVKDDADAHLETLESVARQLKGRIPVTEANG